MDIENIRKIKQLLKLSELAQSKVKFNFSGLKIINPMQQAAANRIYNMAYKLKGSMSDKEFQQIHKDVINEKPN